VSSVLFVVSREGSVQPGDEGDNPFFPIAMISVFLWAAGVQGSA